MKQYFALFAPLVVVFFAVLVGMAIAGTTVPGHSTDHKGRGQQIDSDSNGIPDAGVTVNGHYTSLYAYDNNGDYYWDLGDGRIQGTVGAADELDQDTLTTCNYEVNYRGNFENDPFLNSGWIQNLINCKGYDDNNHYTYLIVNEKDPRYTGNPDFAIWGNWEYKALTISHEGNLVRPMKAVGISS